MTQPPPPEEHPASTDTEAPPPKRHSEAILPFGVGERLDEVAQNRFSRTDWIELAAAVLLALATIVAAWSAYEATRWSGVQAKATRSAIEARSAAGQQTTIYGSVVQIDVQSWITWLQQRATGNDSGAAFMQERFREEFRPAFDAWLALVPAGAIPPGTPFDLPEYAPAAKVEADRLNAQSEAYAQESAAANQTGDNFVLTAVIMASVLFFAGVGTKLRARGTRLVMLLMAFLLFLGGVAFMLSQPQNFGI